jgi:membrane protease YdiL (CAAX protease family)
MFLKVIRDVYRHSNLVAQLVFVSFVVLISLLFFYLLGFLTLLIINPSVPVFDSSNVFNTMVLQGFLSVGLFVIPPVAVQYLFFTPDSYFLNFSRNTKLKYFILTFAGVVVAVPLINFLAEINAAVELPQTLETWKQMLNESSDEINRILEEFITEYGLMPSVLIIAVIPALGEEMFFRGFLQNQFSLKIKNIHLTIWIVAIIFSLFHLSFDAFFPRIVLGAIMGYFYFWTQNLWIPVFAHFINNFAGVLLLYFQANNPKALSENVLLQEEPGIGIAFISLLLILIVCKAMLPGKKAEL